MRKKKYLEGSELFNFRGVTFRKINDKFFYEGSIFSNEGGLCKLCKIPCLTIKINGMYLSCFCTSFETRRSIPEL